MFAPCRTALLACLLSLTLTPPKLDAKAALFPLAFYSPETSVAFGGAITFNSTINPLNNLAGIAYLTLKGQYQINTNGALNWGGNRWRIDGDLAFSRYPNRLYSIGPGSNTEYGKFTQFKLSARVTVQMRAGSWFLGPVFNYARYSSVNIEPAAGQTPELWPGFTRAAIIGLGLSLNQDRRDHPFDPRSGRYTRLQIIPYLGLSQAFTSFLEIKFDHRRYFRLSKIFTWAAAFNLQVSTNRAPYHVLPSFGDQGGGFRLMRGFYGDRFRDRTLLSLQNELRVRLSDRWCAQLFADMGQVAPGPGSLSLRGMKVTLGVGVGFIVDKASRLPIHFEAGFSDEGQTFSFKPMAAF
jgi:outer membrane protein assembly factor BamA